MAEEILCSCKQRYFNRRPVSAINKIISNIEDGNLKALKKRLESESLKSHFESAISTASQPRGSSPLVLAAQRGHTDIVKYIVKSYSKILNLEQATSVVIDESVIEGATALWTSATLGKLSIVKYLVEQGADINHGTKSQSTPIRGAAYDGHLNVVKYLQEKGADIHVPNHCGQSPLGIAAAMKRMDCAKYLISKGASVNEMGRNKDTPLHIAVESGDKAVCKMLVEAGAKNAKNTLGHTPCMLAACHGHDKLMEYLFQVFDISSHEQYDCYLLLGARKAMSTMHRNSSTAWSKAVQLKQAHPQEIPNYTSDDAIYQNLSDPQTISEVRAIDESDETCLAFCAVIFERILGAHHPSTAFTLRGFGDTLIELKKFQACEEVWLRSLEFDKAARIAFELQIVEDLLFAIKGFYTMLEGQYYPTLPLFFKWGLQELEMARDSKTSEMEIVCALCRMLGVWLLICDALRQKKDAVLLEKEQDNIELAVQELIEISNKCRVPCSPVLACLKNFDRNEAIHKAIDELPLPLDRVLKLLLDAGCPLQVYDKDRQFPLHLAVQMRGYGAKKCIELLAASGALLFASNYEGHTALDIVSEMEKQGKCKLDSSFLKQVFRSHFTLEELSAVSVVANRINYRAVRLPKGLLEYIAYH